VLGTVVAIAANYVGYRYWVYRDSDADSRRREITLFLIFSGVGLLIENGTVWFTTYTLGLTGSLAYNLSKAFGTGLGTLFRFFSYRTWVFKAIPELAEPAEPAEPAEAAEAAEPTATKDVPEALAQAAPDDSPTVVAQAERLLTTEGAHSVQGVQYAK
jgi:hypothetical protein